MSGSQQAMDSATKVMEEAATKVMGKAATKVTEEAATTAVTGEQTGKGSGTGDVEMVQATNEVMAGLTDTIGDGASTCYAKELR